MYTLETALDDLMNDAKTNLLSEYRTAYDEGYHDALVDVMRRIGISTDEKYCD